MRADKLRVSVALERHLYEALSRLARRERAPLSAKVHDLLREALEMHEDLPLAETAAERERTLDGPTTLTHDAVWRSRQRSRRR